MSREMYDAMFKIKKAKKKQERALEQLGLMFEYGHGIFGEALLEIGENAEKGIVESLGLKSKTEKGTFKISDGRQKVIQEVEFDVLYPADGDEDFSVTEDYFYCELLWKAVDDDPNDVLKNLMWQAFVEKDVHAKEEINKMFDLTIIGVIKDEN